MKFYFLIGAFILSARIAQADERVLPSDKLKQLGLHLIHTSARLKNISFDPDSVPYAPHSLDWPIHFIDGAHTVAQNYVNFQEYGDGPYYHGGCDLRGEDHAPITTPVSGHLEAGYYGYNNKADGSMDKYWDAWNGKAHDDPYFEVAVVTDKGYRFEFHHVDSLKLPSSIVSKLNAGGAKVVKGEVIGYINGSPFPDYEHTHYNIINPTGVRLNPEYYSTALNDKTAPVISAVFAVDNKGHALKLTANAIVAKSGLSQFVVAATDSHDGDVYVQTPPYASIHFAGSNSDFTWDFRKVLLGADLKWPDITKVFSMSISTSADKYTTWGEYGEGMFLMNLPVGPSDSGDFVIQVGDTNDNRAKFSGRLN